ncbi:MAG TPA: VOC family protein [Candidatus Dormibacteraeota bacterium]|nr:VOC family protein [Candidatus Dormibacteraeota bacterium]
MSNQHLGPYINLQGRAREAFAFYHGVFGGRMDVQPADPQQRVHYAWLQADGIIIDGSDGHPTYPPTVGDNIALHFGSTDAELVEKVFSRLAEGGQVKGPLKEQEWGGSLGWLADRFGINWMISVDPGG